MDFTNILTFNELNKTKSGKSLAPLVLFAGQNPMMSFVTNFEIAKKIKGLEDDVGQLKDKASNLEKELAGKVELTPAVVGVLTSAELDAVASRLGTVFPPSVTSVADKRTHICNIISSVSAA